MARSNKADQASEPFEAPIHISALLAASGDPEPQPVDVHPLVDLNPNTNEPVPGDDKSQEG